MNELELIARLIGNLPTSSSVLVGPGDDCAVLDAGIPGELLLFKTDAVVQDIHFTADTPPAQVGRKALARCLSDIAAMGGRPTHALVTIGLPRQFSSTHIEAVYAGLNEIARQYGVAIVGGETTTNPDRLFLSIALLGTVPHGRCILRSGAQPGDAILVTGQLGGSLAGKHLDFEPRLPEAAWLAGHFCPTSMIDLSDGLATDLRHILHQSHVGAVLLASAIPISRAAKLRSRAGESTQTPLLAALTDGEDFELLFTVPARQAVPLLDAWKQQFPKLLLTCIGKINKIPGLRIRTRSGVQEVTEHGYLHFT